MSTAPGIRPLLTLLGLLAALPAEATPAPRLDAAEISPCQLQLVFDDEFDDLSVEPREIGTARWIAHTPWGGDFGDAAFADPGPDSPFSVQDGVLSITARKDEDGKWQSGLLASADSKGNGFGLQYGYVEARIKLPTGPGTWPAFWLNAITADDPAEAPAEATLEVDMLEYYGHARASYQAAYHVRSADPARTGGGLTAIAVPEGALEADFHTYGAKLTEDHITFYLDGRSMWQVSMPKSHRSRLMILVNLALGSGFPISDTPDNVTMQVDYIRAYAFNNSSSNCDE